MKSPFIFQKAALVVAFFCSQKNYTSDVAISQLSDYDKSCNVNTNHMEQGMIMSKLNSYDSQYNSMDENMRLEKEWLESNKKGTTLECRPEYMERALKFNSKCRSIRLTVMIMERALKFNSKCRSMRLTVMMVPTK